MANHRAHRRAPAQRTTPVQTPGPPQTTVPGKRKAVQPNQTQPTTGPAAVPAPTLTSSPARPPAPRSDTAPDTRANERKRLFAIRPAGLWLVGAAAVALAAVGSTVSQQNPTSDRTEQVAAETSVLNDTSGRSSDSGRAEREPAVSRGSGREERQDATIGDLATSVEQGAADLAATAEKRAAEKRAAERRAAQLAAERRAAERAAERRAAERAAERRANTWQTPIASGAFETTATFGECSSLWSSCHTGLDFAAPTGTPIHSVAAGTVTEVAYAGAYGNRTIVTLEDGTQIWYCHQNSTSAAVGQKVGPGDVIGTVGLTGNVTGPHLHLEVRPGGGEAVDPAAALNQHGVPL